MAAETSPDRSGTERSEGTADSRDTNVQQRFSAQAPKKDMRFYILDTRLLLLFLHHKK
jgi:hypothetical protein